MSTRKRPKNLGPATTKVKTVSKLRPEQVPGSPDELKEQVRDLTVTLARELLTWACGSPPVTNEEVLSLARDVWISLANDQSSVLSWRTINARKGV